MHQNTKTNKLFGTDGIRGIPQKDFDSVFLTKLGMALSVLGSSKVVVGTDTRYSKDMLAYAIIGGALGAGLDVVYTGVLSTPALMYYSYVNKCIGVIITASHNPFWYNGIKIVLNGFKIDSNDEARICDYILNFKFIEGSIGLYKYDKNVKKDYLSFILRDEFKSNKRICIDCANGATYELAPAIFNRICSDVKVLADKPNGYNINDNVGSTHVEHLVSNVIRYKCDIGFSFDGDGDRVICVDSKGNILDGDYIIYILALYFKEKGLLVDNKVVLSVMSNLGVINALRENGIDVIEANVGDKNVYTALIDNNLFLGGESSGHILLPKLFITGDGIFVGILLLKALEEMNRGISDLVADINIYPSRLINIGIDNRDVIYNNSLLDNRVEEIKKELNNDCKIIVRPSGTENLIRLFVMAKSDVLVDKYIGELKAIIESSLE